MSSRERMNIKKRSRVKLSEINGNMKIGKGAILIAEKDTITVNGSIRNKGGFKCRGNLIARNIETEKGSVKIFGNLSVQQDIEVDVKLLVLGALKAEEVSAGMTIRVNNGIEAEKVSAGMKVVLKGEINVEQISAGSKIVLNGKSNITKVSAGRRINLYGYHSIEKISSGARTFVTNGKFQKVSAGMSFIAKGDVEIGNVSAGFGIKLRGKSTIDSGSAGFSVKAKGPISFGNLSAGFSVIFNKEAKGSTASAGFRVKSYDSLELQGSISAGFSCSAKKKLSATSISSGRKIKAKYIEADSIKVNKRGRLIGIVKADNVILEERARACNLHVRELDMYERSKARNVFAEIINIEDKAVLKGKVEYTKEIYAEDGARIRAKPKKVEELPSVNF